MQYIDCTPGRLFSVLCLFCITSEGGGTDTVQGSVIRHTVIQYRTVQHRTVWYIAVQYSTVQFGTVQCCSTSLYGPSIRWYRVK